MQKIIELFKKYKSIILYLIFGALTTAVNVLTYYAFYNLLDVGNVLSVIIAWVLSVIFAYITNKLFVFESTSFKLKALLKEITSFFGFRLLTGVLDVIIMYFAVDIMDLDSTLFKLISNVLVIILNYAASKLIIFKNGKEDA